MGFKKFLSEILESIDFKRIKWREILVTAVIAVFAGVIVIPSIRTCVENDSRRKCNSRMYVMMDKISWHINAEGGEGEWHDMLLNGRSVEALEMAADAARTENDMDIDVSDYYIEKRDNILYLRCKKHQELKDRKIVIGDISEEEKDFGTLGWNSNTNRRIADVTALGGRSFIVDAGSEGKYCVSAWDWADYVAGATAEDGKVYGASVVFYDGVYYYYPDGFKVRNSSANSSPFRYAVNPDSINQAAYCIPVDTSSVVSGRFSTESHEGSLMAEDGKVYIWQTRPSQTQSKGWLRIECELKKL